MSPEMYSIIGVGLALAGLIMPRLSKIDNAHFRIKRKNGAFGGIAGRSARGNYSQPRILNPLTLREAHTKDRFLWTSNGTLTRRN